MNSMTKATWAVLAVCLAWPLHAQGPSMLGVPATQVAAGGRHACALTSDGGVMCWGHNNSGQLGDGSNDDHLTPVEVTGLAGDIVAVAAGYHHNCALDTAGRTMCWGRNLDGQLGNSQNINSPVPVTATGLSNFVAAIVAGRFHSCALMTWGGVKCWGRNANGQLGTGNTAPSSAPVGVHGLASGVVALAAGAFHSCALIASGEVKCWGRNTQGRLGDGTTQDRHEPREVIGLDGDVLAIAGGGGHTCALTSAGAVECWGANQGGQLGNGMSTDSPVPVTSLASGAVAISAGSSHSCALTDWSGIRCWGRNNHGQLGDDSTSNSSVPVDVAGAGIGGIMLGAAGVAAGDQYSCAMTRFGGVRCWGANGVGQLGTGDNIDRDMPADVARLAMGAVAVAAGGLNTCALTTAGGVHCWGANDSGQLGDGSIIDSDVPVEVSELVAGSVMVAVGGAHVCARTGGGALKCWGYNNYGQLGVGSDDFHGIPQDVPGLGSGVIGIALGHWHSCAVTSPGDVLCWGSNYYGQVGDTTSVNRHSPTLVTGLASAVAAVKAGDNHTCALTNSGGVACWGSNIEGQLGAGMGPNQSTAVGVSGLGSGVARIGAGTFHACALAVNGTMQCWGDNRDGQLGDGTTNNGWVPVTASELSAAASIMVGGFAHSCVLADSGVVKCWGANGDGQLGDGGIIDRGTPADVVGLSPGVLGLAAGSFHSCALTGSGAIRCWGDNARGQLGNGSVIDQHLPVTVLEAQHIDFEPPAKVVPGSQVALVALSAGGGAVSFDVWTPDTCSISGNTLLVGAAVGLCGVRASQPGGSGGAGNTIAAAPQELRLIRIADLIFVDGFES